MIMHREHHIQCKPFHHMRKNCRKLFRYHLKVKISAKFEPIFEIILKQNELIQLVIKNCEKNVHYYKIFDSFYQSSKMVQFWNLERIYASFERLTFLILGLVAIRLRPLTGFKGLKLLLINSCMFKSGVWVPVSLLWLWL